MKTKKPNFETTENKGGFRSIGDIVFDEVLRQLALLTNADKKIEHEGADTSRQSDEIDC